MQAKQPFSRASFWVLFAANFFFFSSHNILNNLPIHLGHLGLSHSFVGFFMNINAIGLIVFVVLFSRLTEKVGKKRMMFGTYALGLFSYLVMFVFYDAILLLVAMRLMASLSYAVGFTANAALAFEVLPPQKRTGGIALFGISGVLSSPVCAFLGERLLAVSPRYLFLFGAVFTVLAIVSSFFVYEPPSNGNEVSPHSFWHVAKQKKLTRFFLLGFFLGGAFSTLSTFIPQYTSEKFQSSLLAAYFSVYSLTSLLFRFIFIRHLNVASKKKLLSIGFFLALLAMLNTAGLIYPWQIMLTGILYGLGHTILYPSLSAAVVHFTAEENKYAANSAFIAFYTMGSLVITTGLGKIGDTLETGFIFLSMAILCGIGWIVGQKIRCCRKIA